MKWEEEYYDGHRKEKSVVCLCHVDNLNIYIGNKQ